MSERTDQDIIREFVALLPPHKCGLFITHNEHRDYYETVEQFLEKFDLHPDEVIDLPTMIATDEVWQVLVYPDTPIGSYAVYGPTLEACLLRLKATTHD